nr:N-acetyltransferase [Sphingobium boeckii]
MLDRAFGADRRTRPAYALREGTCAIPALSFAAVDMDGALLGTLQSWPVKIADEPLVMIGPVAVEPGIQRSGIGQMLMRAVLKAASDTDAPPLMMIGDPEYYGRFFGFTAEGTAGWELDGPVERRRLLVRARFLQNVPQHGRILPDPTR